MCGRDAAGVATVNILQRIPHPHLIVDDGFATGARTNAHGHFLTTALAYRCVLCGEQINCITEEGWQQIAAGVPVNEAIQWES